MDNREIILDIGKRMYNAGFVASNDGNISIRLSVSDDNMKSFLFLQAEQNLRRFLREKGILASAITMDADAPLQDEVDGKLKNVIDCR